MDETARLPPASYCVFGASRTEHSDRRDLFIASVFAQQRSVRCIWLSR